MKGADGESEILTLDPATLEYRPQAAPEAGARARRSRSPTPRADRTLFNGKDKVGAVPSRTLAPTLVYAANVTPDDRALADDVDRVMRWGFGWELGPFETLMDAIGIEQVIDAHATASPICWRGGDRRSGAAPRRGRNRLRAGDVPPPAPDLQILRRRRTVAGREEERRREPGRSGRRRARVEFHSKMNAIGGDTIQMLQAGVREARKTSPRSSSATTRRTSPPAPT